MNKFNILTNYIPILQADNLDKWVVNKENEGTLEHPIQIPFAEYSKVANNFINDFYTFHKSNEDMQLSHYRDILKNNGLDWNMDSIKNANVLNLNAQSILALIMSVIRTDRFCDGILLDFFQNGCILKWLERLKNIK